jgi:hypothetical protein
VNKKKTHHTRKNYKNEDKMKVTKICSDEKHNDLDGVIDEKKVVSVNKITY